MSKLYTFWLILGTSDRKYLKRIFAIDQPQFLVIQPNIIGDYKPILYAWTDKKDIAQKFMHRSPDLYFRVFHEDDLMTSYDEWNRYEIIERDIDLWTVDISRLIPTKILTTNEEMAIAGDMIDVMLGDLSMVEIDRSYDYTMFKPKYQCALDTIGYTIYYDMIDVWRDYPPQGQGCNEINEAAENRTVIADDLMSYGYTLFGKVNVLQIINSDFWKITYINSYIPKKKGEIDRAWEC